MSFCNFPVGTLKRRSKSSVAIGIFLVKLTAKILVPLKTLLCLWLKNCCTHNRSRCGSRLCWKFITPDQVWCWGCWPHHGSSSDSHCASTGRTIGSSGLCCLETLPVTCLKSTIPNSRLTLYTFKTSNKHELTILAIDEKETADIFPTLNDPHATKQLIMSLSH